MTDPFMFMVGGNGECLGHSFIVDSLNEVVNDDLSDAAECMDFIFQYLRAGYRNPNWEYYYSIS